MMKKMCLVLGVMLIVSGSVSAVVIIDENFDGLTVGTMPAGWGIDSPDNGDPVLSGVSSDFAASGLNSFKLVDQSSVNYKPRSNTGNGPIDALGNNLDFGFSFYWDKTGASTYYIEVSAQKDGSGQWASGAKLFRAMIRDSGTNWFYLLGSSNLAPGITGSTRWIDVAGTLIWDQGAGVYTSGSISFDDDGDAGTADYSLTKALTLSLPNVDRFRIDVQKNGVGQAVYFDDLSMTLVPEPATLALLGLGGLVLRRRRNK